MNFTFPPNKTRTPAPSSNTSTTLPPFLSSQGATSQLFRELRITHIEAAVDKAEIEAEVETDSCSICDHCTCTSLCWMPRCEKHWPRHKTQTSNGESEGMTGEEAMVVGAWLLERANRLDAAAMRQVQQRSRPAAEQVARATGMMRRAAGIVWREWTGETLRVNNASTEGEGESTLAFREDATTTMTMPAVDAASGISSEIAVQPGTLPPGTNHWTADNTVIDAWAPPRLSFAPLPADHNTDGHDLLLSRQRTPYSDGPYVRPQPLTTEQPTTFATCFKTWCKPSGTYRLATCISTKVGNWLHLRRFALRSRIGERKIWLREKFDRSRSARAHESEQRRGCARAEGPLAVTEEVSDDEFREMWRGSLEMVEDVERVRDGEIFEFERGYRARRRFDIDTALPLSRD